MSSIASSVAISETQQPKPHQLSYGSVCSGIEAATVAWSRLGWSSAWLAEIEPFPSAVLAYHYPTVPNLGDMTRIRDRVASGEVYAPDILVGGTPCQAFSVAGARNSLDDDRGQLTLEYVRLADEIDTARSIRGEQPSIIVWENVPGVLSTKDNAFGCFLGALSGEDCELQPTGKKWTNAGCVFGPKRAVAWRVLDAQYFGLAQRRKRVFVVASARKDFHPDKVLFEFDGVRRDSPPSRSERQETTRSTTEGFTTSSIAKCLTARTAMRYDFETEDFIIHGTQDPLLQRDTQDKHAVAFAIQGNMIGRNDNAGPQGSGVSEDVSFTLTKGDRHGVAVGILGGLHPNAAVDQEISPTLTQAAGMGGGHVPVFNQTGLVRRLIPKECERLQGFPDEYTKIPYRNKAAEDCPDGARYAALGKLNGCRSDGMDRSAHPSVFEW